MHTTASDPLRRSLKAELSEPFYPLGALLRVETNQPEVLEAARESFGRYPAAGSLPAQNQYRVRLLVDSDFSEAPPWSQPVFRGHQNFFFIQIGRENFAVADLERRAACGFISPAMAADAGFFRSLILECLSLVMLTHSQYSYLHAAAVVWKGRSVLLAGPRLVGKSTLAYACAKEGLAILSDDVVYLEREHCARIWGKPWHLKLLPDTVSFFSELKSLQPRRQINNEVCMEVNPERFIADSVTCCASPGVVCFLECDGGAAPRLDPLPADEAFSRMRADLILDSDEAMRAHLKTWQRLCGLPAYRLIRGANPHDTARFLKEFCRDQFG